MAKRAYRYAATFEFEREPPEMVRGELVANRHDLAAKAAVAALRKAHPKRQATSLVVMLEML